MAYKDGVFPKRLKQIFGGMKQRCYNPNFKRYKDYGGRGITICDEWLDNRIKFYEWSENNGYTSELTIDRIDYNGNYEPNNCRWVTYAEQANNRKDNVYIEYNGEIKTQSQWSKELGVSIGGIKNRLEKGKDILDGFDPQKYIKINGEIHTAKEWESISGIPKSTILSRIKIGWKNEDLLKPKIKKGNIKYMEIEGECHTMDEWCKIIGINRSSFRTRINKGLKGKELIAPNSKLYLKKEGRDNRGQRIILGNTVIA